MHALQISIPTEQKPTEYVFPARTAAIASLSHGTLSGRGYGTLSGRGYLREVSFEALLQCAKHRGNAQKEAWRGQACVPFNRFWGGSLISLCLNKIRFNPHMSHKTTNTADKHTPTNTVNQETDTA